MGTRGESGGWRAVMLFWEAQLYACCEESMAVTVVSLQAT